MVKSTEREGSGLFRGGMPSVLTEGKHVPLSQHGKNLYRDKNCDITAAVTTTLKEPLSIGTLHSYFH